jgi:hypothetical protein
MLKIKALVFVQDESYDDNGVLHITDLYNRKAMTMFLPNHMQSAEECIKENIERTLSKIMGDVDITLKTEFTNDIQYFYEKNMICGMWGSTEKE